jgi:GH25 family lysozyme M1 (1,4-beta-N-acetylmuramidase)
MRTWNSGFVVFSAVFILCSAAVKGQEQNQDEVDPAVARPYWLGMIPSGVPAAPVPPYVLTKKEEAKFGGTFGIDLSHYSFDLSNDSRCQDPVKYVDPKCSCSINWQGVASNKVAFVYSKATDGSAGDPSFPRFWLDLTPLHASKVLFRGAYHFLRPGVSADQQAQVFLQAIGAVNGQKPLQLPPILDVEWSSKRVVPGTAAFAQCPKDRIVQTDRGYYCDMWYQMSAAQIASMAKQWIEKVQKETGLAVIIYTNPTGWWNPVMNEDGNELMKTNAVWTSRYTANGPQYDAHWQKEGGSPKWRMAPIPRGASYPKDEYNVPYVWQFTENGSLPTEVFVCDGQLRRRSLDLNWVPVAQPQFQTLFGVATSNSPRN